MKVVSTPPSNPTEEQRHEMLRTMLEQSGRADDYENIIKLLSPPPDILNFGVPGQFKGMKIGIIGGGLAGLSAAYELRKLGADIIIFEAEKYRLGGRIYTHYFTEDKKYYGEFGAFRIPVSHETAWYYIDKFCLDTNSLAAAMPNNFLYVHNTRLRITQSIEKFLYPKYNLTEKERNTPWPILEDYAFNYILNQLTKDERKELISILPKYSRRINRIMNSSTRATLEELGLSQGAISLIAGVNSARGALLDNSYSELLSGEYSIDFRDPYYIKGGNINLPLSFYQTFIAEDPSYYYSEPKHLLGRVEYKAGTYVKGIYKKPSEEQIILRYRDEREPVDMAETVDYVICTIPFSSLRNLEIVPYFSNMKMQAIFEYNYTNAQKTNVLCKEKFWEMDTLYGNIRGGISFTDLPIQSIIYPPKQSEDSEQLTQDSSKEPGVLLASYNLNQNATRLGNETDRRRFELIKENVKRVHGMPEELLNFYIQDHKTVVWNREPNFLGAFAEALPGQQPLFSYEMTKPEYEGKVFFAGEHISSKHGWIQGALFTGKAAANDLAIHANDFYSNYERYNKRL